MSDLIKAVAVGDHTVHFQVTEKGVTRDVAKRAADGPFSIDEKTFEELALFGAVRKATKDDKAESLNDAPIKSIEVNVPVLPAEPAVSPVAPAKPEAVK